MKVVGKPFQTSGLQRSAPDRNVLNLEVADVVPKIKIIPDLFEQRSEVKHSLYINYRKQTINTFKNQSQSHGQQCVERVGKRVWFLLPWKLIKRHGDALDTSLPVQKTIQMWSGC